MSSIGTSDCEMLTGPAFAVADLLEKMPSAAHMTLVTIAQSDQPHISVSMNATRTPSESSATGTGLDGLSITELASSRALAKQEWLRLNPIKDPQSTLSTT